MNASEYYGPLRDLMAAISCGIRAVTAREELQVERLSEKESPGSQEAAGAEEARDFRR